MGARRQGQSEPRELRIGRKLASQGLLPLPLGSIKPSRKLDVARNDTFSERRVSLGEDHIGSEGIVLGRRRRREENKQACSEHKRDCYGTKNTRTSHHGSPLAGGIPRACVGNNPGFHSGPSCCKCTLVCLLAQCFHRVLSISPRSCCPGYRKTVRGHRATTCAITPRNSGLCSGLLEREAYRCSRNERGRDLQRGRPGAHARWHPEVGLKPVGRAGVAAGIKHVR
jgi:hypothetical protein